jgi:hypothetical protein
MSCSKSKAACASARAAASAIPISPALDTLAGTAIVLWAAGGGHGQLMPHRAARGAWCESHLAYHPAFRLSMRSRLGKGCGYGHCACACSATSDKRQRGSGGATGLAPALSEKPSPARRRQRGTAEFVAPPSPPLPRRRRVRAGHPQQAERHAVRRHSRSSQHRRYAVQCPRGFSAGS